MYCKKDISYIIDAQNNASCVNHDNTIIMKDVYDLARLHNLEVQIFDYYNNHWPKEFKSTNLYKNWKIQSVIRVSNQKKLIKYTQEVLKLVQDEGIQFIQLKGLQLSQLYSNKSVRIMNDIDILVRSKDLDKINNILIENGYQKYVVSSKDIQYISGSGLMIEVHHKLFKKESRLNSNWFTKICMEKKIKSEKNVGYRLDRTTGAIYLLLHLIHHLKNGGAGLRNLLDISLYFNHYEESINREELINALNKFGVLKYAEYLMWICNKYYYCTYSLESEIDEDVGDELFMLITSFGAYGKGDIIKSKRISTLLSLDPKVWISSLFPSYRTIEHDYSHRYHTPMILPMLWIKRWKSLLQKDDYVMNIFSDIIFSDEVKKRRKLLKYLNEY